MGQDPARVSHDLSLGGRRGYSAARPEQGWRKPGLRHPMAPHGPGGRANVSVVRLHPNMAEHRYPKGLGERHLAVTSGRPVRKREAIPR